MRPRDMKLSKHTFHKLGNGVLFKEESSENICCDFTKTYYDSTLEKRPFVKSKKAIKEKMDRSV